MILQLSKIPKTKTHSGTYYDKLANILQHHFAPHLYISTDGSEDNDKTARAAILNRKIIRKSIPNESSI